MELNAVTVVTCGADKRLHRIARAPSGNSSGGRTGARKESREQRGVTPEKIGDEVV